MVKIYLLANDTFWVCLVSTSSQPFRLTYHLYLNNRFEFNKLFKNLQILKDLNIVPILILCRRETCQCLIDYKASKKFCAY